MTKKQKRLTLVLGVFLASALSITLVLTALNSAVAYFYTPSQLEALETPPTSIIRLGGLVASGSVKFAEGDETKVTFVVADELAMTAVTFKGVLPDLFREGQGVVVQGRLREDGGLDALEVLAKHDENYMPREVAEALKEQGRWQEGEQ